MFFFFFSLTALLLCCGAHLRLKKGRMRKTSAHHHGWKQCASPKIKRYSACLRMSKDCSLLSRKFRMPLQVSLLILNTSWPIKQRLLKYVGRKVDDVNQF